MKIAVILSGCGVFDGAEIHESVLTLLALEEQGASYQCFAPDINQYHVINHLSGETSNETRNVLVESARIARGKISPVSTLNSLEFDGLIFPGGFGAAKNLSNFIDKGKDCEIELSVSSAAKQFITAGKPVGFICISPVMIPKLIDQPVEFTIGDDPEIAKTVEAMGGRHICCPVNQFVIDKKHKIVSTPAYMLANNITEAAAGIRRMVTALLSLV